MVGDGNVLQTYMVSCHDVKEVPVVGVEGHDVVN